MQAGLLACSLIEFYSHINNGQSAESERERGLNGGGGVVPDTGVYR